MKFNVTPISTGKCKVKLIPETEQEKQITDQDTFQFYYQRAITSKFGPKALLMSIDEMVAGFESTANYIMQGGSLGQV